MIQAAEKLAKDVGVAAAFQALGVPRSSVYRARHPKPVAKPRPMPERALSQAEKATVRQELKSERFWDSSPRHVYATLLDEGTYLCHWRTMCRILDEHTEVQERRNQLQHPSYTKPELPATGPNQLWSWDTLAPALQVQVLPSSKDPPNGPITTCTSYSTSSAATSWVG